MRPIYSLDSEIENHIKVQLKQFDLTLDNSRQLAGYIKQLSDFFIQNPSAETPWHQRWCQIAYLIYFFPLNALRAKAVIDEGQRTDFFSELTHVYDFGCGMGSGSFFLKRDLETHFIEKSTIPKCFLLRSGSYQSQPPRHLEKNSLALFSYSLTEQAIFPEWALQSQALMIIEPSTQQDGRRLLQLRSRLQENGYSIWAPCTHQGTCPLLGQSKNDWCHDRIHFEQPEWWQKIESHLPFKNKTITMSYLLVKKQTPPPLAQSVGRLVGDQVKEKGKTRQLICRGPDREFLSWLDRSGPTPTHYRGELFEVPVDSQKVSNEIRL